MSERDFAREMAAKAVAPLEGRSLDFDAALEMATSNVASRIDPILREAVREVLRQAAMDVCMYCGDRAIGYGPACGPNEARNYWHGNGAQIVLCAATAIHHRSQALARRQVGEQS